MTDLTDFYTWLGTCDDDTHAAYIGVLADRRDLGERLSELLCTLTGGRMSKTNYDVRTMVAEIDAEFERHCRCAELEDQRDRARDTAVALEQENARLEATKNGMRILADARQVVIREQAAELDGHHQEATAAHSVIEEVGLLQEAWQHGFPAAPHDLERVLNGATFGEVWRNE